MNVTNPKVHMGTITAGEARDLYPNNPVILLPMGSQEDQGPHAQMGDYLLPEKIAELAAVKASQAGVRTVVAPVLAYGGADWFGSLAGGMSMTQETLTQLLDDLIASLRRNGLTRVIFINGHGGNVGPIAEIGRRVYRQHNLLMPSLYLWRIAYAAMPKLLGPEKSAQVSGHGSDPLTSIGLHLFPDAMRPDLAPEGPKPLKHEPLLDLPFMTIGSVNFEGAEVGVPFEYDVVYNSGVSRGNPRLCNAETGKILTDHLTDVCARFIAHYDSKVKA